MEVILCGNTTFILEQCISCSGSMCAKCNLGWFGQSCSIGWAEDTSFNAVFLPLRFVMGGLFFLAVLLICVEFVRLPAEHRLAIPGVVYICSIAGMLSRAIYFTIDPPWYNSRKFSYIARSINYSIPRITLCIEYSAITIFWAELVSYRNSGSVINFPRNLRPLLLGCVVLFIVLDVPLTFLMNLSSMARNIQDVFLILYSAFLLIMDLVFGCRILQKFHNRPGKVRKMTRFVVFISIVFATNIVAAIIYILYGANRWVSLFIYFLAISNNR
jgi:hypothetical protein